MLTNKTEISWIFNSVFWAPVISFLLAERFCLILVLFCLLLLVTWFRAGYEQPYSLWPYFTQLTSKLVNTDKYFLLFLNVRSLRCNIDELRCSIGDIQNKPFAIWLSEIWLTDKDDMRLFTFNGYGQIVRKNRQKSDCRRCNCNTFARWLFLWTPQ